MLAESTLFFSQLHKEIYFLRGLFLRSDMTTLTFNFESSIFYMQLFNFFLPVFFYFFWQVFFYLLFNFKKCLDLIYNCLIRIHQVFHWLKNNKKAMPNEVKKIDWCITFLNAIETLWFYGAIIAVENFRYYIFYVKNNLQKTWLVYDLSVSKVSNWLSGYILKRGKNHTSSPKNRSSHQSCYVKKVLLEILQNLTWDLQLH